MERSEDRLPNSPVKYDLHYMLLTRLKVLYATVWFHRLGIFDGPFRGSVVRSRRACGSNTATLHHTLMIMIRSRDQVVQYLREYLLRSTSMIGVNYKD